MFGRGRLPQLGQPGVSIFELQEKIGQSSPEVHAFFPRNLSLRRTIENAWADTFLGTPKLSPERTDVVDATLRWFEPELNPSNAELSKMAALDIDPNRSTDWAKDTKFSNLSFSSQRVALFLRAVVKSPDLVVLDEAFSGMDELVRDKCMRFLEHGLSRSTEQHGDFGKSRFSEEMAPVTLSAEEAPLFRGLSERQALICVSHVKEEVPNMVRDWVCLPEANEGQPARFGRLRRPLSDDTQQWNKIWGMSR